MASSTIDTGHSTRQFWPTDQTTAELQMCPKVSTAVSIKNFEGNKTSKTSFQDYLATREE